jgi:hypothetical protein
MFTGELVLLRIAVLWVLGIFVTAILSVCAARPSQRRAPSLWILLPLFVARATTLTIGLGLSVSLAMEVARQMPLLGVVLLIAGAVLSLWASYVLIQIVQRLACRAIGMPARPIQWTRGRPRE